MAFDGFPTSSLQLAAPIGEVKSTRLSLSSSCYALVNKQILHLLLCCAVPLPSAPCHRIATERKAASLASPKSQKQSFSLLVSLRPALTVDCCVIWLL